MIVPGCVLVTGRIIGRYLVGRSCDPIKSAGLSLDAWIDQLKRQLLLSIFWLLFRGKYMSWDFHPTNPK